MKTMMLAAAAALSLGIGSAYAQGEGGPNGAGYAYPDFWGQAQAQHAPSGAATGQDNGAIGTYMTRSNHGTWLFPPSEGGGENG